MQPPADRRVGQAEHFPAHSLAVPSVTRIAIEPLHRVRKNQIKEFLSRKLFPGLTLGTAFLQNREDFILLPRVEFGKSPPETALADLVGTRKALPVALP